MQISGTTRTAQPVPSATPAVVRDELLPAGLEVIERDTVTYVYRLLERGEQDFGGEAGEGARLPGWFPPGGVPARSGEAGVVAGGMVEVRTSPLAIP